MALRLLTGPELDQMEADRLTSTFAPDPERMAAAAAMAHCGA